MKILIVHPIFYPVFFGGISKIAYDISVELAKRGHDITVLTTDALQGTKTLSNKKIKVNNLNVYYLKTIFKFLHRYKIIIPSSTSINIIKACCDDADVIHIHAYRNVLNILVSKYAIKFRKPYILQAHGCIPRVGKPYIKWLYDQAFGYKILRTASKVIALNRTEAQQYKDMGVPEGKITVIPNGIDLFEYADLPPQGSFKKKFNIPEDKKIILYLGRIHAIKGIDFLVKAYAYLVRNIKYDNALLVITGSDDGYLNEIKKLTASLNLVDRVLFTGPLYGREKLEAYVDADVYVLPSKYEIFGITVLEAYACGKPVIASRVGGLKDLVVDGVTGLLIEHGNIKQLVYAMLTLLRDDCKRREMGYRGRKFLEKGFTIVKVVNKLENLYNETI